MCYTDTVTELLSARLLENDCQIRQETKSGTLNTINAYLRTDAGEAGANRRRPCTPVFKRKSPSPTREA